MGESEAIDQPWFLVDIDSQKKCVRGRTTLRGVEHHSCSERCHLVAETVENVQQHAVLLEAVAAEPLGDELAIQCCFIELDRLPAQDCEIVERHRRHVR